MVENIFIFDAWRKHWTEGIQELRRRGYNVRSNIHWGPDHTEWADVAIFHPVNNNLIQASRKDPNFSSTFIIAEAIDVDIHAGHPGAVDWSSDIDCIVYMADHLSEYAEKKFNIPRDVRREVIPGGVDMNKWCINGESNNQGFDIAWIGRLWIAKNLFDALQIFRQILDEDDDSHPWKLHVRGNKWHPDNWWRLHCMDFIWNTGIEDRVVFHNKWIDDLPSWLSKKRALLQTSFKEAFGYVVAQAAASGVKPVVQRTWGAEEVWGDEWVVNTHSEAVKSIIEPYNPADVRNRLVSIGYTLENRIDALEALWGGREGGV
jgi:glycosyltransferase involved in cell wall biosynthesis